MRAAAVLEEVFPTHPNHPGVVHYLIHCYDDPIHAPLGLRPARIYARIAPDAGHAQHMTSHIFLALGMWEEVVKANQTAMAVVDSHRALAGKPPGQCGHYNEWLEYGYLQLERVADARRLLDKCRERAEQQASAGKVDAKGFAETEAIESYADMRAHFLIGSELWQGDVAKWSLPAGEFPLARFTFDYTDALVAYRLSQPAQARASLASLEADAKASIALLDRKKDDAPEARRNIELMVAQLRALLAAPTPQQGLDALQRVAASERALPLDFGPPGVYEPTEELLGGLNLQLHRPAEARKAFTADLARAPGRRLAIRGLAQAER
jgi:hypothetical protein